MNNAAMKIDIEEASKYIPQYIDELHPNCMVAQSAVRSLFNRCQRNYDLYQQPSEISEWLFQGRTFVALANSRGLIAGCRSDKGGRAYATSELPFSVLQTMTDHYAPSTKKAKAKVQD